MRSCLRALLLTAVPASLLAEDWPGFRGPRGDGTSSEKTAPLTWGPDQNVKWKFALPAPGNGSPIVSKGRVFVTCGEDGGRKRSLYCLDRKDGSQLWVRTVNFDKKMPTHGTNPHGSSTPAADGERVVVWHASAGLYCYDFEGKELWSKDLGEFRHMWGYGTSPVIHENKVVMHCGPGANVFLAAFDVRTGEELWRVDEPIDGNGERNQRGRYMGSWSTPVITKVDGKTVAVCSMATRVNAHDVDTGEILWYCQGLSGPKGDLAYTSPIIAGDICVAMGGFGGPAIGFKMGGSGDITESSRLWRKESNPQRIGSGVAVDGHVYIANAGQGLIQCIDPMTGKVLWEERGGGGDHWGSTVYAAGRLYVTDQRGTTLVFEPDPAGFEELARNRLGENSNSTPAVSDGEIFVRTFDHVYCIAD